MDEFQVLVMWVDVQTFASRATLVRLPNVETFAEAREATATIQDECERMVAEGYMLQYSIVGL